MRYARIEIEERVYNSRLRSVPLVTIFGTVYAPNSKIIVEGKRKPERSTSTFLQVLVPCWVFWNKCLNPCQLETGFIEQIERRGSE